MTTKLSLVPSVTIDGDRLAFAPADADPPQAAVWDGLWRGASPGRLAVSVAPNAARVERLKAAYRIDVPDAADAPAGEKALWQDGLREQLYALAARMQLPGDFCPALAPPRAVHGQSQGMVDLFGACAELQEDGNVFPHPLPPDPARLRELRPAAWDTSRYWQAVAWTRYARAATGGAFPFRNAVMVGPLDLVNYLLGSTVLLEWLYTEEETVHHLLAVATEAIIAGMTALREAAGGAAVPLHTQAARGGFDLCSETRSLVSADTYEAFDAPYLRRIGEAVGPFGVHSCGSWERTVPSVLRDGWIRTMNGQSKENDLAELCRLAGGRITLSIAPSANLHERFLWPDTEAFLRHVLETAPETQAFDLAIGEDDLPLLRRLHQDIRGRELALPPPLWQESTAITA